MTLKDVKFRTPEIGQVCRPAINAEIKVLVVLIDLKTARTGKLSVYGWELDVWFFVLAWRARASSRLNSNAEVARHGNLGLYRK